MYVARMMPVLLALPALACLLPGCGGQSDDPATLSRKNELLEIHEMYTSFVKRNQRPPQQLSDLTQKANEMISPAGTGALRRGDCVAVFGVDPGKDSGAVLAYEKDAPTQGGWVVLANGTPQKMTADALKAALPGNK
jgi:hypothetical protein